MEYDALTIRATLLGVFALSQLVQATLDNMAYLEQHKRMARMLAVLATIGLLWFFPIEGVWYTVGAFVWWVVWGLASYYLFGKREQGRLKGKWDEFKGRDC